MTPQEMIIAFTLLWASIAIPYGAYKLNEFDKSLDRLDKVINECFTVCREINQTKMDTL